MKSLDAAKSMHILSERTGVSVESLAKFKKAAGMSGTDIDSVAKSIAKLSKELYSGNADKALDKLGLSSRDASGQLKSADKVIFDVANKFKAMPAGIDKTALAIQLFGKAGAEMVPMLNMGGDAIEKMGGKMTTAFAKKAHEYEVKLTMIQGKIGGMATSLTIALIPALDAVASAVLAATDAMTKLPGWLQTTVGLAIGLGIAFTALAPAIAASTGLISGLAAAATRAAAAQSAAAVAATQLAAAQTAVGASATGAGTALAGAGIGATLAGWAGGITSVATSLAALVAGFVSAPILIGAAAVATAVAIFSFRDQIADAFRGLFDLIANPATGFIAMIGGGWNLMLDGISSYASNILPNIVANFAAFFDTIIGPENGLIARLGQTWNQAMDGMRDYAVGLVRPITAAWESIIGTVRGVINGALNLAGRAVNAFIDQINRLIVAANSVSAAVRGPRLGMIQPVEVPQFAVGGRVDRPTLIMAGEAGPEYIVPQKKVPQFLQAQIGDQGLGIRQGGSGARGAASGSFAPVITLQTGPVIQQPDGSQWIRIEDAQAVAADAVDGLWDRLQSYDGRQALGIVA
jgi:hypothetical protein